MRILVPLRRRNFALLCGGMAVSLIGDGIYAIAIVWEALRLSNAAMAISLVGVAWTVPTLGFLLVGGALSDRFDRRRLMLIACLAQALAVGAMAALETAGVLRLWSLLGLVAVYGTAEAFFLPTFRGRSSRCWSRRTSWPRQAPSIRSYDRSRFACLVRRWAGS